MKLLLTKEEEIELIRKFRNQGDSRAFAKLYTFYFDYVYNNVMRLLKDADLAADITQDTFVKIAQKIGQLDESGHFKSWISTISRNLCMDHFRLNKRRKATEEYSFHASINLEDEVGRALVEERICKMKKTVDTLQDAEKELIMRKYIQREKISQICVELNISESAVKMRLKRVKAKIRKAS